MGTPSPSRPREPSLFPLAGAEFLPDSWHSPRNAALPSLVSPTSNVGRAESACCPGSAVKSHDGHELAPRRLFGKFCSRNDWALSKHLSAQPQKIAQHYSPPKPSSSCTSSWNEDFDGAPPSRSRRHLCLWSQATEEQHGMDPAQHVPVASKHHLIL